MGKKKTGQAQQRLPDIEDTTENNTISTNRPPQKQIEDKVNRIYDIFPQWAKVDIKRALEENEYDDERVVQLHLQGGDNWQEVSKKKEKPKETNRPKGTRRPQSGTQNLNERPDRGGSTRGRGKGRTGGLRTDRNKNDNEDITPPSVKEFTTPVKDTTVVDTEDVNASHQQGTRSFKSYSEAAAVSNEQPLIVPEPVVEEKRQKREKPIRQKIQQPQPQQIQTYVSTVTDYKNTQSVTSPTSPPKRHTPTDVILPPQSKKLVQNLSPQERKQESVVLPVDFNAVNVQFGSLGIDTEIQTHASAPSQTTQDTHPSAPTLTQDQKPDEYYTQSSWGTTDNQYQTEQFNEDESSTTNQYQQPYQQQPMYGFQQPQQPRTGEKGTTQRTSPNTQQQQQQPYGKQPYPYGMPTGGQNPYQSPYYPSYPPPYMMPNQFQYQYPHQMPGSKYGQFYNQKQFSGGYNPTSGHLPTNVPSTEESQLDYNKQFDMGVGQNPYFFMPHHNVHPQSVTQTDSKKKDTRSPNEQQSTGATGTTGTTGTTDQQHQQHQQMFGYPYAPYGQYSYMFQPQGFPQQHHQQHQYSPQPTTQQGAQTHGKARDQQQQSSLTNSTWQ